MSRTTCKHHQQTAVIVIRRLSKIIFFNVFIFSPVLKPIIPQLSLCSAHSRLAKRHRQHFKCSCTFNLIFKTKINTVFWIHFFRIIKNRRVHQNTPEVFICQKQTDNPKWWILSTYIANEIQLHTIDNVLKNWTDHVGYSMASRGSHLMGLFSIINRKESAFK